MSLALELIRVRLTALTTLSALTGAILAGGRWDLALLVPVTGVFLLASGATVMNQVQERDLDAKMARTQNRPLPAGRISPVRAGAVALGLVSAGFFILLYGGGFIPALLGIFAVFMYNVVYTALKKKTPFAVVPGAVIGAVPPAIGWTVMGRALNDPVIISFMVFFFLWQVPHFWLLFEDRADEYRQAGFPVLAGFFGQDQVRRITFSWIIATAGSCLIFPVFGVLLEPVLYGLLWIAVIVLVWRAADALLGSGRPGGVFLTTNLFALFLMVLLIVSCLAGRGNKHTILGLETGTERDIYCSHNVTGDIHGIH